MFPPFEQKKAASVLEKILSDLKDGSCRLVRSAKPAESRKTDSVMLGVLVCADGGGKTVNLVTVSGISFCLEGIENFVPPVVSAAEIEEALSENDGEIHLLTEKINAESHASGVKRPENAERGEIQFLRARRKKLCGQSLLKVFEKYEFCNLFGKKQKMTEMFGKVPPQKKSSVKYLLPPTGTGDCCAPKLLSFAFEKNLTPLSLAETKVSFSLEDGACVFSKNLSLSLTPPCDSRCAVILPHILGLEILYVDEHIIVVNKQSGLLSVPGRTSDKQDCVVSRVRKLFPFCIEQPSVHRLDMETSGLMVLAFTKEAHRELRCQFERKEVEKKYVALLDGILSAKGIKEKGKMELFFRVDVENRPHQIWDDVFGKSAVTEWKIEDTEYYTAPDGNRRLATRVSFVPVTGRTHQLRLAAADSHGFGVPIIGDSLYGTCAEGERLMLHATNLSFTHPVTKERMNFFSPANFL